MKPVNSKERSKLLWQFVFIFFALCILPIAIIFYTYWVTPGKIDDADQEKLMTYSAFEHHQKVMVKLLTEIDSNIRLLNSGSNLDPDVLKNNVLTGINNLSSSDTTNLVKTISTGYTNYFSLAKNLSKTTFDAKKANDVAQKTQAELDKINAQQASTNAIVNGLKGATTH